MEEKIKDLYRYLIMGISKQIQFSKGYKEFEEQYEKYKEYLERKEIKQLGWTLVIVRMKDEISR